jgi:hypothetical protein
LFLIFGAFVGTNTANFECFVVCLCGFNRYSEYKRIRAAIDQHEGGLDAFSRGYEKLGFTRR